MSHPIIDELQLRVAAMPRPDPWASPAHRNYLNSRITCPRRSRYESQDVMTQSENPAFAAFRGLLLKHSEVPGDRLLTPTDPLNYLVMTTAGQDMIEWLMYNPLLPANCLIREITGFHNDNPGYAEQDVRIKRNPIHAWVSLRTPVIERIQEKGFAGLFQKQERLLNRLGEIWIRTTNNPDRNTPVTIEFNTRLKAHTDRLPFPPGLLTDVFFRYEILIAFCQSCGEKTGVGALLEADRPALKLFRLLKSKAILLDIP